MTLRHRILGFTLASAAGLTALVGGCKSSSSNPASQDPVVVTDRGFTCEAPLSIAGVLAQRPFPAGVELLPVNGDLAAPVAEGAVAFVRDGKYGAALAVVHEGKPVAVPDSSGAVFVLGATLPGSDLHVLVFSRAKLAPRAEFAGATLVEVDASQWSLEIRLLDAAGQVRGQKSLPYPGEMVKPLDIDTTGDAQTTSVLVQLDKRGVVSRFPGDLSDEPVSMQIVEVNFTSGSLVVAAAARESVTEDDWRDVGARMLPQPVCPENACGTVIDPLGNDAACEPCSPDSVCVDNVCRLATSVPGGACVPKTRDAVCNAPGSGTVCGRFGDGCGGVVDCGGCGRGLSCGAKEPGRCGDPTVVRPSDVRALFGSAVCGCFVDAKQTNVEVACKDGSRCERGTCVPEVKP